MGDEVDDDWDSTTDDDVDDDGDGATTTTTMANAQRATTTMTMATARRATKLTTMATAGHGGGGAGAEGEILGEDLMLDAPPIFALGGI